MNKEINQLWGQIQELWGSAEDPMYRQFIYLYNHQYDTYEGLPDIWTRDPDCSISIWVSHIYVMIKGVSVYEYDQSIDNAYKRVILHTLRDFIDKANTRIYIKNMN